MFYKSRTSGEILERIRIRTSGINTYRVVDAEFKPVKEFKGASEREIHRIISGYDNLEQIQLKLF